MKYLIIIFAILYTGLNNCSSQSLKVVVQCTDSTKLSFTDPLSHDFVFVDADSFSDNSHELIITQKYQSNNDTLRYFTTRHDQKLEANCGNIDEDEALKRQGERLYKLFGVSSVNEKFLFKKSKITFECLRYNKDNYVIAFCANGKYVRMELYSFCNSDEFKSLLNSLDLSE